MSRHAVGRQDRRAAVLADCVPRAFLPRHVCGSIPAPSVAFSKTDILSYLPRCRQHCAERLAAMTDAIGSERCGFPWYDMSVAELLLLNLRHAQHHAGQLALVLRRDAGISVGWIGSAPLHETAEWRSAPEAASFRAERFPMTARKTFAVVTAVGVVVGGALTLSLAQGVPGIRRIPLQRQALDVPGREVVQVRVELEPGAVFGRHSHPGAEIVNVLEGSLEYAVDGQPPVTLRSGGVLFIPAGTVHAAKNVGQSNGAELATYIVETGKPLVVMAR
jgi:quercetin dioxygenase-like cupin family protein